MGQAGGHNALARPLCISVSGRELLPKRQVRIYVELRLLSTLDHLARRVDCIAVREEKVHTGPLKGARFRIQMIARLVRGKEVRSEATDRNLYGAIDQAAEALAREVEYVESRLSPGVDLRCA